MDNVISFICVFLLGFGVALIFTAIIDPKAIGYRKGQTDYAKGIINYQCDTLKNGDVHCYKIK